MTTVTLFVFMVGQQPPKFELAMGAFCGIQLMSSGFTDLVVFDCMRSARQPGRIS
jgi:hypothetical protein